MWLCSLPWKLTRRTALTLGGSAKAVAPSTQLSDKSWFACVGRRDIFHTTHGAMKSQRFWRQWHSTDKSSEQQCKWAGFYSHNDLMKTYLWKHNSLTFFSSHCQVIFSCDSNSSSFLPVFSFRRFSSHFSGCSVSPFSIPSQEYHSLPSCFLLLRCLPCHLHSLFVS